MILKKTYPIKDWNRWNYEIDNAAIAFHKISKKWPNILLANISTLEHIDAIENEKRNAIEPGEPQSVNSFSTDEYSLDFCDAEEVAENSFSLIYDEDPDGEDEDSVPEDDNL